MEEDRIALISTKGYQQLIGSQDGKNLYWTTDIDCELPIKIKQFGSGSEAPLTISDVFKRTV